MFFSWYKKFSSQPHQPFFTSGILFFILFMSLFVASYSNILILDSSVLTYHAYSMIFVIFIQFFLGFLFVVFPRFLVHPCGAPAPGTSSVNFTGSAIVANTVASVGPQTLKRRRPAAQRATRSRGQTSPPTMTVETPGSSRASSPARIAGGS